jgi:hypothetical protein
MATLTATKIQSFIEAVYEKKHNLSSDSLKVYLTNATPSASASNVKADVAEIAGGNGYTAGGIAVTVTSSSQTGGTYSLAVSVDTTITATGAVGPYQYAVLYNDTATNKELIAFWGFGSAITLASGDTHRIQLASPLISAS